MDTNTEYKIVDGYKKEFELECNELAKDGWIWSGSLVIEQTDKGFWYAQLMTRCITPTK